MNNLKIFNEEVIPVYTTDTGEKVVVGRELHKKLGIKANYRDWFPRMCRCGFDSNIDFSSFLSESTGGRPAENHILTLDMAKHIAMIQRSEIGMQIRQKLIDLEKQANDVMPSGGRLIALALIEAEKILSDQSKRIEEMKPKVHYLENILDASSLATVTTIAKQYGFSAREFNLMLHEFGIQYRYKGKNKLWHLYSEYQKEGYTHNTTYSLSDHSTAIMMKWTNKGVKFLYDFLKGKGYLPLIEREEQSELKICV